MLAAAAWLLASLTLPGRAAACSCATPAVEQALAGAVLVAELEILEVGPPADPDSDMTTQRLRARVVRVFSTDTAVTDGDEIVFVHQTCNSVPHDRDAVGTRYVGFLGRHGARFAAGYCSFALSAWEPIPHVLVEARRRWLARR